jgi:hypothetical protein
MSASHLSIVRRLSMVFLLGTLLTLLSGALSGVPSAGATTASAVSGYQVVYGPTTASNSLSPKTARAVCPLGKRVIGGGGAVYQPGVGYVRRMALTELRPVFRYDGTSDAYLATAAETPPGTSENWLVEAYAVCADPLPGMFMVAYTTSPSSSSVQTASAGCPWVIGTGGRISNSSGYVVLQAARPSATGDLARVRAHEVPGGYGGPWSVTAYAVCVSSKPAGYEVVVDRSSAQLSETYKDAAAICPYGKNVLGAGGAISNTAPGNVSLFMIHIYPWQASVAAIENTPTNLNWDYIVATAVCASS